MENKGKEERNGDAIDLAEYDALRREIELHIEDRRKIENQVIIGVAAIYSWIFTREVPLEPMLFKASLAVPPILSILALIRWGAIQLRTMKIGEYLNKLESSFERSHEGWESFLLKHRKRRPFWGQFEGWSELFVWGTLIVGTFSVLIWFPV